MRSHAAVGARASPPATASHSTLVISAAAAAWAYVNPSPVHPSARACTSTSVVADQLRVPSASGASVGIVNTRACTLSSATAGGLKVPPSPSAARGPLAGAGEGRRETTSLLARGAAICGRTRELTGPACELLD